MRAWVLASGRRGESFSALHFFSSLLSADVTLRELRHLLSRSALRDRTFPFVRTCRTANGDTGTACASVSSYPRRRASRPHYLARGKLLKENLEIVLRPSRSATRSLARSLSRCSAERGENARRSSRMSGVIAPGCICCGYRGELKSRKHSEIVVSRMTRHYHK